MKRTIKPFAVEVRRSRKGPTAWPAEPQPASPPHWPGELQNSLPRSGEKSQPEVLRESRKTPISAAPITGRILPALEPEQRVAISPRTTARAKRQPAVRAPRKKVAAPISTSQQAEKQDNDTAAAARVAVGMLNTEHTHVRALAPKLEAAAAKPARADFRLGERWKSRLPAVIARKHLKPKRRTGHVPANAAE